MCIVNCRCLARVWVKESGDGFEEAINESFHDVESHYDSTLRPLSVVDGSEGERSALAFVETN